MAKYTDRKDGRSDPLRKVTAWVYYEGQEEVTRLELECGHIVNVPKDGFGRELYNNKRRCRYCAREARTAK